MQSGDEKSALIEDNKPSNKLQQTDQPTGARPKVKNPKEAKRKRFVMKPVKTTTKPGNLESVSETEEGQTLLQKSDDNQEASKGFFGVRSYVHTFYEAMALDDPRGYEDIETHFGYIIPKRRRRKQILMWRLLLGSGIFILLMGLISMAVGFLVPKKPEVIDSQEDIEIIDRYEMAFNKDLDICKIIGMALFSAGGLIIAIVLIALIVITKRDNAQSEEILMSATEIVDDDSGPKSPIDVKVPATEAVAAVQPKRDDPEEVVMTNAGLCKVP